MSKNTKWNYAVVSSIFGDLWVGRTKLPIEKGRIYATFEEATQAAISMTDSISNRDELESATDDPEENLIAKSNEHRIRTAL